MNRFTHTQPALRDIAARLIELARARGASACEVDVSEGHGQSVTVRRGEVETIEYTRDKGLGVSVYLGHRRGFSSSSDFSAEALALTVDAALSIARHTAADPCAGLPDVDELARDWKDPGLYFPWTLDIAAATEMARRCEAAALGLSPLITNSEGATVSTHHAQFVSANSLGFFGGFASSRHTIACSVIASQDDEMQRDDWYASRRDPDELPQPEAIGAYAGQRALARLGARRIPTTSVPVLFEAPLACGLLGNFAQAASGGSLYRKSSFLLDALGKPIFSPNVTITERPGLPKGLASRPFDDDGVATHDRDVVSKGVLMGYFLGTYSARKLGMKSTGNAGGSHNLILTPGPCSFEQLIREMGRGLIVTELLGQGVNYVTGDYSRGAAGYWVEGGEIRHPVHEVTIAGNLADMFRNIVAGGSDLLVRGGKQAPSVVIGSMKVAGE